MITLSISREQGFADGFKGRPFNPGAGTDIRQYQAGYHEGKEAKGKPAMTRVLSEIVQ